MESINPATGEVIARYSILSDAQIHEKLFLAETSSKFWASTSVLFRAEKLLQFSTLLLESRELLSQIAAQEMGKRLAEGIAEIEKCSAVCRFYAERAEKLLQPQIVETDAGESFVRFDPLGAVLGVMPWNFPFLQVIRFAAPALMSGNVCLLKHASNVSGCALEIESLFLRAGFPEGVFQTLLIRANQVAHIIESSVVSGVAFTGSEEAGKAVAEAAGRNLKKLVVELGGSDPFIVLHDADLTAAIPAAIHGRLQNCGQSCIAAKRIFVVEELYEQFVAKLLNEVKGLRVGNPCDRNTNLGPLAGEQFVSEIDSQVKRSVDAGAQLICGGKRVEGEGCYFEPTILAGVTPSMPAFCEETFGPVFCIIPVSTAEEALELANSSSFGLGASVWTKDRTRAEFFIRGLQCGMVFINSQTRSVPSLPFGGIKSSGFGRELGTFGLFEFVNVKSVSISGC